VIARSAGDLVAGGLAAPFFFACSTVFARSEPRPGSDD